MSYIELKNICRNYRITEKQKGLVNSIKSLVKPKRKIIHAVKDISINIEAGESVGLIGPNGAGKSTTVKMLTGILVPSSGSIQVNGLIPHKDRKKHTAGIGVVFGQRTQLWWDLPVCDTFDLLRYVYRVEDKLFKDNMEIFNDILGLADFFNQPVRQLSLGQRMRAEIAAALLHSPACLFFLPPMTFRI